MPELLTIPLHDIDPPEIAARETMDDVKLRELADDIAANGLQNAILVFVKPIPYSVPAANNNGVAEGATVAVSYRYEIISGHRRYEAHKLIGKYEIECKVYPERPANVEALKLSENLCREDLNDAQVAVYLAELWEKHGYTEEQLCAAVRRSADWVGDRLRLLRGCPKVLEALRAGQIAFSVARELNKCTDDSYRNYLTIQAVEAGSSARVVAGWVLDWKKQSSLPQGQAAPAAAPGGESQQSTTPPAVAVTPNVCWICGGDHFPFTIHWHPVHDRCKDSLVRELAKVPQEG